MSSPGESVSSGGESEDMASGVAAQMAVTQYSCNRLGRVANPPGFSLTEWFRPTRRR